MNLGPIFQDPASVLDSFSKPRTVQAPRTAGDMSSFCKDIDVLAKIGDMSPFSCPLVPPSNRKSFVSFYEGRMEHPLEPLALHSVQTPDLQSKSNHSAA